MAQYAGQFGSTPVVMDVQDLFFVSRLRSVHAQVGRLARLKKTVAWLAWTRYERLWYQRCQLLMTLTDEDRAALHALVPEVPAFTNSAVISARQLPAPTEPDTRSLWVGCGGQFGHPPNVEALVWLNEALAPALAARCPGVRIAIAGRGARQALAGTPHPALEWLGFVDDYDAFLRSCRVFLAPLRSGGGVKVKVLEALACGCPVVTTPIGAEGIALTAGEGLVVAQGVAALVDATAAWLERPATAAQAGARGAEAIAQRFGVDAAVRRFEAAVLPWLSGAPGMPESADAEAAARADSASHVVAAAPGAAARAPAPAAVAAARATVP